MSSLMKLKEKVFYGWVLTIDGLVILASTLGVRQSFGVFFKSIELEFSLGRGATSSIYSIYMILCAATAILGGWILDRYGPRIAAISAGLFTGLSLVLTASAGSAWQLFISYSLLLALGTGAVFTIVTSTVSKWFIKNRRFALGITQSGGSLGVVIIAPVATYLIVNFDWRTAFMIMGAAIFIIVTSASLLLRRDPADSGLMPDGAPVGAGASHQQNTTGQANTSDLTLSEAFRTSDFWFLGIIWLFSALSSYLITTHTVPHAIDIGISPIDAAFVLSLITGISIPSRMVIGKFSDILGGKALAMSCALLQSLALFWIARASDLWMFYIFGIAFGISWGGLNTITTALVSDIFGIRNIGTIMGVMSAVWSGGAAIGSALGGFTFDITGNYFTAFITAAIAMLIVTLLLALTNRKPKEHAKTIS